MASVESRLTALAAELQRRAMIQAAPADGLSASLFAMQDELSALDDVDKAALLEELNRDGDDGTMGLDLTMLDVERMIDDWRHDERQH